MISSTLTLSASDLRHNLHFFQKNFEGAVFPVLKSNAYGHGILEIAAILQSENIPMLAVQSLWEAEKIVERFPEQKVLVLGYTDLKNFPHPNPLTKGEEAKNIVLSIGDFDSLEKILSLRLRSSTEYSKFHLSFNTGMNREGFEMDDVPKILELLEKNPTQNFEGIWSHFADGDGEKDEHFDLQTQRFETIVEQFRAKNLLPKWIHTSNSHSGLRKKMPFCNAMRLGISLFGLHTAPKNSLLAQKFSQNLHPVFSWHSQLVSVRTLKKGESVSYNCTFVAEKDMTIGTVPVGYFEGVSRKMSNRGAFFCNGKICKILGRVCMNYCMIDLSEVENPKIGDRVELIGKNISANQWAVWCETINYEITTRLSESIVRTIL